MRRELYEDDFAIACFSRTPKVLGDNGEHARRVAEVVIDLQATGCRVDVHVTDQWVGSKVVDHGVKAPGAVAVAQVDDRVHGAPFSCGPPRAVVRAGGGARALP